MLNSQSGPVPPAVSPPPCLEISQLPLLSEPIGCFKTQKLDPEEEKKRKHTVQVNPSNVECAPPCFFSLRVHTNLFTEGKGMQNCRSGRVQEEICLIESH